MTSRLHGRGSRGRPGRREDVLAVLREASSPQSIVEIADRVGVHPNTVRFHLDVLTENGQVERVTPEHRSPGRPPQLFRAVRRMDPNTPRRYRVLAEILTQSLGEDPDPSGRAVEAGRAWGRSHHDPAGATEEPVKRLVTLLEDLGFGPEVEEGGDAGGLPSIGLRSCPFLELAMSRPQITCPIHLGLMQGAMDAWGSGVSVDRLDPFVEPDLCRAHLRTRPTSGVSRTDRT
ncbi:helix-turn-helix transcriptional regulator [Actinoallomurus oryzae]|uniref:helix-turn-helix transcriptional regulator n=1 Tax=Actinoallomurus oryzae TaxID=502180 RepID=UPI0031E9F64B